MTVLPRDHHEPAESSQTIIALPCRTLPESITTPRSAPWLAHPFATRRGGIAADCSVRRDINRSRFRQRNEVLPHLHFVYLSGEIFESVRNAQQRIQFEIIACRRQGLEWLPRRTILRRRTF